MLLRHPQLIMSSSAGICASGFVQDFCWDFVRVQQFNQLAPTLFQVALSETAVKAKYQDPVVCNVLSLHMYYAPDFCLQPLRMDFCVRRLRLRLSLRLWLFKRR